MQAEITRVDYPVGRVINALSAVHEYPARFIRKRAKQTGGHEEAVFSRGRAQIQLAPQQPPGAALRACRDKVDPEVTASYSDLGEPAAYFHAVINDQRPVVLCRGKQAARIDLALATQELLVRRNRR